MNDDWFVRRQRASAAATITLGERFTDGDYRRLQPITCLASGIGAHRCGGVPGRVGAARGWHFALPLGVLLQLLMANERPAPRFFLALVLVATALLVAVLFPLLGELLLAAVLASVLWSPQQWLARRLGGRRGVAAALVTIAVILLVLGPLGMLVTYVIREGSDGVRFVSETARSERVAELVSWLPDSARDFVTGVIARLPRNLDEVLALAGHHSDQTAAAVGAAVAATGSVLFRATMMLIAFFFLLVRGDELVNWLDSAAPLGRGQTRELLATFKKVSFAVFVSALVTAAAQATAALIGFYIAQVPSPIFFAAITFFLAFIPAIGAAVVCLAAALLLVVTGHPYMAIFLAAWGIFVVGLVDNLIKPLLVKRGMEIHGAVVFFSLIGGLAAFGAIGLLVGPLVVAFFLALVRMYHRDYTPEDPHVPRVPGHSGDENTP
jgi:predicted PurR-regulated permease PerM